MVKKFYCSLLERLGALGAGFRFRGTVWDVVTQGADCSVVTTFGGVVGVPVGGSTVDA